MSNSIELMRAWVIETLGSLADDDHNSRLRDTLHVFLQENGSFKATAERLSLHKNTVQYRVRKAEEGLGYPIDENRLHVELALLASHWLGATVPRHVGCPGHDGSDRRFTTESRCRTTAACPPVPMTSRR
jgi:hypothetical protein